MLPRSQPPWETWQCPVVSLSCSVLNVSVYCGLLILSHNSVGIFGVLFSLQFQMCILPWLYLPQDTQHFSLPPSCAFPTPSPFLSQSFSVLKNKTAAPLSSKQHTPSPYLLHLSTPFMGFKQSFLGGFNIYLLRAEWVMLKYLFIWTYLVPVSVSSLSGTIAVCKIPRLCVYSMGVFFPCWQILIYCTLTKLDPTVNWNVFQELARWLGGLGSLLPTLMTWVQVLEKVKRTNCFRLPSDLHTCRGTCVYNKCKSIVQICRHLIIILSTFVVNF